MLVLGWLYRSAWRARYAVGRRRICEKSSSATRSARDSLNRATSDAMFKIVAVAVIGILVGIGFFDLGQEAYTLGRFCSASVLFWTTAKGGRQRPVTKLVRWPWRRPGLGTRPVAGRFDRARYRFASLRPAAPGGPQRS